MSSIVNEKVKDTQREREKQIEIERERKKIMHPRLHTTYIKPTVPGHRTRLDTVPNIPNSYLGQQLSNNIDHRFTALNSTKIKWQTADRHSAGASVAERSFFIIITVGERERQRERRERERERDLGIQENSETIPHLSETRFIIT